MKPVFAAAAVLVALVVVLSGFGAVFSSSPRPPNASDLGRGLSPSAISALERSPAPSLPAVLAPITNLGSAAAEVGSYVGLSSSQVGSIEAWLDSLTPAQAAILKTDAQSHAAPSVATLESLGLTPADINYYCLGASIAAGTAIGAFGGPLGAIIGFIGGAVVGYYGCQQSSVSDQLGRQFLAWADAVMGGYGNEANLTAAEFQSIASALNVSTSGWERAADHAALTQLGNTSFNISLALFQSGIYANLAPVASAYEYEMVGEYNAIVSAVDGHGGTNDVYGTIGPAVTVTYPAGEYGGACGGASYCALPPGPSSYLTAGTDMPGGGENFIPAGANITVECSTQNPPYGCPAVVDLFDQINKVWYNVTVNTASCPTRYGSEDCNVGPFVGPTGMYRIPTQSGLGTVVVPGGQPTPTAADSGWTVEGTISNGGTIINTPTSTAEGTPTIVAIACNNGGVSAGCANPPYFQFDMYGYSATPGPTYANLEVWLTTIEWQAAESAEAYWAFLRAAGFDSAQSIPADCLIPAPYLVLPSSINEANLNVSEWESLYLSTLEGMGHFYNVTLSGTAFCGTQAVQQWSWGGSVWGNLYVNATGFVYLNNGTSPVDYNGKALPTEKLGNRSTWAIGDTYYGDKWYNGSEQLLLMPTISTVSIPVGVRYEVPADNPIQIYAVQTGLDLWLTGNGTANGSIPTAVSHRGLSAAAEPLGTLTAGDAIYLTSCQVGGTASGNCSVTVQTVNVTLVNITCPGPCQQSQQNGGTFGGLPNPFSWLAGLFSSLLGGGPLGSFFGSLLAGIVILAVILGLVYVVYRIATKKKGSGAGGQTVVVEGGRR
jgi:hypothetical protein